jgi:hypothetical protein
MPVSVTCHASFKFVAIFTPQTAINPGNSALLAANCGPFAN